MYVLEANFEASQGECQIILCGVPFSIKLSGNSTSDDFLEIPLSSSLNAY